MKADVYTRITDQIVAALEQGVRPWMKPWDAAHAAGPVSRPLRHNGKPYGGINVVMLWASAMEQGFSAPIWMTFRQAKELGAHVKKGEKGTLVDQRQPPCPAPTAKLAADSSRRPGVARLEARASGAIVFFVE